MRIVWVSLVFLSIASAAEASDLEKLAKQGYGVVETTQVNGEYNGCEFNKQIPLTDGLLFQCNSYDYEYSYMPEVLILKHVTNGSIKVLIDGEEQTGTLYKAN